MADKLARPPLHIPLDAGDFMDQFMAAWREHVEGFSQMKGRGGAGGGGASAGVGGAKGGKSKKSKGGKASSLDHLPEWKRRLVLKKQRDAEQSKDSGVQRQVSVDDVRARVQERYRQMKAANKKRSPLGTGSSAAGSGGTSGGGTKTIKGKNRKKKKRAGGQASEWFE